MVQILPEPEAKQYVLTLLEKHGPMTTMEIENHARREDKRCSDETVLFLTKLKSRGIINGAISEERRGWIWWV